MRLGTTPPLSTGAGRKTSKPPAVPSVEDLPCSRGGNHVLANSSQRGGLVTACVGCGETWTALDAAARKAGRR